MGAAWGWNKPWRRHHRRLRPLEARRQPQRQVAEVVGAAEPNGITSGNGLIPAASTRNVCDLLRGAARLVGVPGRHVLGQRPQHRRCAARGAARRGVRGVRGGGVWQVERVRRAAAGPGAPDADVLGGVRVLAALLVHDVGHRADTGAVQPRDEAAPAAGVAARRGVAVQLGAHYHAAVAPWVVAALTVEGHVRKVCRRGLVVERRHVGRQPRHCPLVMLISEGLSHDGSWLEPTMA
mmetsp:Transcript_65983/g.169832  ORF Transcript_65983/g.169832 Transcript_65983/m.169832 type:complete len:237 (+) Transcript_65983:928-1638(+)